MSKLRTLLSLSLVSAFVAGCSTLQPSPQVDTTNKDQYCSELQHKLLFESDNPNRGQAFASPTRQAMLMREYRKHNCAEKMRRVTEGKISEGSAFLDS